MPAGHNATRALRMPAWAGLSAAAAAVTAWIIYRPHVARPVDAVDFSEFLPFLEGGASFFDRVGALAAYYAGHGRFNLLQYAGTVARWSLFGTWSPGWQVTRLLVMLGATVLAGALLRRLGASRIGAAAGAACFLAAPAAASSWVRMTMAEATATVLVLALTHRALGFRDRDGWRWDALLQASGAAALLLLKEMFLPLLLLPAVASLARREHGTWRLAAPDRRSIAVGAVVATTAMVVAIPIVAVFLRAPDTGYVSLLGATWVPPDAAAALWAAALVPFKLIPVRFSVPWLVAMVAWLTIAVVGWGPALRDPAVRARTRLWLAASLGWPLAGILIYLPWPAVASFYGLPYLLGTSAFLAFGLTFLQERAAHGRRLALAAAATIGMVSVTDAQESAARYQARQELNDRLIAWVADSVAADSVFVRARLAHRLTMAGPGPTLARHAAATRRPWPPTRDVPCDGAHLVGAAIALVRISDECPGADGPPQIVERFRYLDWRQWRRGADSITARVERMPRGA